MIRPPTNHVIARARFTLGRALALWVFATSFFQIKVKTKNKKKSYHLSAGPHALCHGKSGSGYCITFKKKG